jgi:hypothetical protein
MIDEAQSSERSQSLLSRSADNAVVVVGGRTGERCREVQTTKRTRRELGRRIELWRWGRRFG